uniref:Uncharacterized protein n=1 Tax=Hyaloperonospora arabidopsidis (strain Emoy2) TaxID=559515 RepID=M4BZA6_HYAAE
MVFRPFIRVSKYTPPAPRIQIEQGRRTWLETRLEAQKHTVWVSSWSNETPATHHFNMQSNYDTYWHLH